jgi:thiol-disulfide isomerase/thioredoxin
MTTATLLFALITATNTGAASEPVLLDFHASWCGPCRQMRPAVEELVRKGYPVKSIDIDRSPKLAARYRVTGVPTFIVVDASGTSLARSSGSQPVERLVQLYSDAKAKLRPAADEARDDGDQGDEGRGGEAEPAGDDDDPAPRPTNPHPWETVVRIRIDGQGMIGFGSGTIIHSTPGESIILTCAHIFKLEGRRQAAPSRFPNRIIVDLFDGRMGPHAPGQPGQVHYANESFEGEAIDYDFGLDVGLIRIRPGKRLPASRVVPAYWRPKERMHMTTVGCSEGHDATAWTTVILNPSFRGLSANAAYEAIECNHAPKQGRSGGGLYTDDGYVAGVCDFAEPRGNHGLYASPASIHRVLDRNRLTALHAPVSSRPGTLVADGRANPKRRPAVPVARAQSPDRDESNEVTIPPPELLGISSPGESGRASSASKSRRTAWHPTPRSVAQAVDRADTPETTDIKISPEVGGNGFEAEPEAPPSGHDEHLPPPSRSRPPTKWRPARPAEPSARRSN